MLNFRFQNPTTIYFGKGQVKALEEELRNRARKVLIITGRGSVKKNGIFNEVMEQITKAGVDYVELSGILPNPRLKSVYEGIELCRKESVDFLLPIGGGSVIDAAKAIAAGAEYDGDVWDFFEADVMPTSALPVGTVVTLSATGSEMNANAVISREDTMRKLALSSSVIRPVFSVLDPAYTFTVNRYHTMAGIADIMAHIFECYLSPVSHTEVQDALAEGLLRTCIQFGPVVCDKPCDYEARANILWTSTLALNGLVRAGTMSDWTCHLIEHEISAIYDISHGVGLAMILPGFMKVVLEKYGSEKFARYGVNVWGIEGSGNAEMIAEESIRRTREFFSLLGLPSSLGELDISDEHFEIMSKNVVQVREPVEHFEQLTQEDIKKVFTLCL